MNQERYIPADRKAQILLLIMTAIGMLIFFLFQRLYGLPVPVEGSSRAVLDTYAHSVNRGIWIVFAISIPFTVVWSAYLARMGIKGLACEEFPPPGSRVVMKTRIRTGTTALLSSWMALIMAIAFWLPVLGLGYSLFLIDRYTY